MTTISASAEPIYRLRARTQLLQAGDTLLLALGDRRAKIKPFNETMQRFLHLLSAGTTRTQVRACMLAGQEGKQGKIVEECLTSLLQGGFIEQVNLGLPADLDPLDLDRFERLLHFFSEFEQAGMTRFEYLSRLRKARVAIVGTGGLGSWVVYNLLCCGVGFLRLIDGDKVEASNLNRSILYTEDDIGALKVEAATRAALRFAPRTQIEQVNLFISCPEDLAPHVGDVDLVVGVADQPVWLIREWVARAGLMVGVATVQASGLRVGPFYLPGRSSCAMCDWMQMVDHHPRLPAIIEAQRHLPKGTTGSISPLGTITAGVLSLEIFRHLSGYGSPKTLNAVWEMHDGLTAALTSVPPHPTCPVCAHS